MKQQELEAEVRQYQKELVKKNEKISKQSETIMKFDLENIRLNDLIIGYAARVSSQGESIAEFRRENENLRTIISERAEENLNLVKDIENLKKENDKLKFDLTIEECNNARLKLYYENKWYMDGSIFDKCHKISEKFREANKEIQLKSDKDKEIEKLKSYIKETNLWPEAKFIIIYE